MTDRPTANDLIFMECPKCGHTAAKHYTASHYGCGWDYCSCTLTRWAVLAALWPAPMVDREALLREHERHSIVVDGPPDPIGFRCSCGFRQYEKYMTPEAVDRASRLHIIGSIISALELGDRADRIGGEQG